MAAVYTKKEANKAFAQDVGNVKLLLEGRSVGYVWKKMQKSTDLLRALFLKWNIKKKISFVDIADRHSKTDPERKCVLRVYKNATMML